MRPIFKKFFLYVTGLAFSAFLHAQNDSAYHDIVCLNRGAGTRFSAFSGSTGISQSFINKLAFGGYIGQAQMKREDSRLHQVNHTGGGYAFELIAEVKRKVVDENTPDKKPIFSAEFVSLSHENIIGAAYEKPFWQLIFRGNDPYLGKEMPVNHSGFKQITSTSFSVIFSVRSKTESHLQWLPELGFTQVSGFREMKIRNSYLFTDADRNYIDVKYNLDYKSSGYNSNTGLGYGITTGFTLKSKGKRTFVFQLKNLGFSAMNEMQFITKQMDSTVRMNQTQVNFSTKNNSEWANYFRDTLNQKLAHDTVYKSNKILLPFKMYLQFKAGKLMVDMNYIYLPGYLPQVNLSYFRAWSKSGWTLRPILQLGGFDTYNLNASLAYNSTKGPKSGLSMGFYLNLMGIEAMALPKYMHGAGISAGIRVLY